MVDLPLAHDMRGQRHQLGIVDFLAPIGELLHLLHYLGDLLVADLHAVLAELLLHGVGAGVFPDDDAPLHPYHLRPEGLVGGGIAQDPVDVYPRLMGEGVVADDGLVARDGITGEAADKLGGGADLAGVDGHLRTVEGHQR